MLRIALADDQALIRHALKALLETLGGIKVVVEADSGDGLLDALASHEVNAVLADIRMPGRSGVGALEALRQRGNLVPVILLTTFDDPVALKEGISAGASGYLLKDAQPQTLKQVLEAAVRGQRIFHPGPTTATGTPTEHLAAAGLTAQETAILRLVATDQPPCSGLSQPEAPARPFARSVPSRGRRHRSTPPAFARGADSKC
jgi:DNA-binding NarL/FixJ family response regulator